MLNVAVIEGRLARPAELRSLPSGSVLVTLEVTVRREPGPAETTPVVCFDAPTWVAALEADAPVIVVGRVRRRFFRAGGATQSRTEVVAEHVLRPSTVARARRALTEAMAAIEVTAAGLGRGG